MNHQRKRDPNHWLSRIEDLKPGDPCDVRGGLDGRWYPGVVEVNGGAHYWRVRVAGYAAKQRLYKSFLAASQRTGRFDPPDRLMEAVRALPDTTLLPRLAMEMRTPLLDALAMGRREDDVFSPYIENVRCRGQLDAWPPGGGEQAPPPHRKPFEDEVWAVVWGPT
jgi:hypothetical protein